MSIRPKLINWITLLNRLTCCILVLSLFAILILRLAPYLSFPYDIDPSDGDVLNIAQRVLLGKQIYTNWSNGHIFGNWTPVYYYYLGLSRVFDLDPAIFGRISNIVFLSLSLILGATIAARSKLNNPNRSIALFSFALYAILMRLEIFSPANALRSDTLCLLIALSACFAVTFQKKTTWLVALPSVLSPLTKQPAIVVPVGIFLFYLIYERKLLKSFVGFSLLFSFLFIIPLEIQSHWHFLVDTFIMPLKAFGTSAHWERVPIFLRYCYPDVFSLWIVPFLLLGIWSAFTRTRAILPIVFVFIVDCLIFLKTSHNDGASSTYLWLHWVLVATLSAIGLGLIIDLFQNIKFKLPSRIQSVGQLLSLYPSVLCVYLAAQLPFTSIINIFAKQSIQYRQLTQVGDQYQELINRITRENPGQKWYADRFSMALVRAGNILDHEACTLGYADRAGMLNYKKIRRDFSSGKYPLIQHSGIVRVTPIDEELRKNYTMIGQGRTPDRGKSAGVEIYKFVGRARK